MTPALPILVAVTLLGPGDRAADFRFDLIQEEWIRDTIPEGRREAALRPHTRHLIALLGSECWYCRELASIDVLEMGPRAAAVLAWARHSGDAEVRYRVDHLIRAIERSLTPRRGPPPLAPR